MKEKESSEDSENLDINDFGEKNLDNESKIFFYYISKGQVNKIDEFLSKKNKEIWKYLTKDEEETVIHMSIKTNKIAIISIILKYCQEKLSEKDFTNFINKGNSKGITALHLASFQGNVDLIKYLIHYGGNINALTKKGLNVLHYAAQGNKPNSLVYFYLFHKNEIDLEKQDKGGSSPLHWASYSSSVEFAMYLLGFRVKIDLKDYKGDTPLHLAVIKNSYKMVQKLLQNDANIYIKNQEGKTPKDIALKSNLKDIYELLKESEGCQFCHIKAPTRKETKSRKNIIIAFFFQAIGFSILFFFNFPFISINKSDIAYGFFLWGYILFTILFMVIYIKLIFMNPERPERKLTLDGVKELMNQKSVKINLFRYCPKCLVPKNKYLRHCVICDQCCKEFDHHCYWINNCVGKNNYSYFIAFLFLSFFDVSYILIISIYSLFVGEIDTIQSESEIRENCKEKILDSFGDFQKFPQCLLFTKNKTLQIVLNIILLLSNLGFFYILSCLIVIHTKNLIKRFKKKKGRRSTVASTYSEDNLLIDMIEIK